MIRTGDEYRDSIRDGREVFIGTEKVADVTTHPAFKPVVDAQAKPGAQASKSRTSGHHQP